MIGDVGGWDDCGGNGGFTCLSRPFAFVLFIRRSRALLLPVFSHYMEKCILRGFRCLDEKGSCSSGGMGRRLADESEMV